MNEQDIAHKKTKIYILFDRDTNEVRYVGKTVQSLNERLHGHLAHAMRHGRKSKVSCWVRSLRNRNSNPGIMQIEECEINWQDRERHWISWYKQNGHSLTNITDGGDVGGLGFKHRNETIEFLRKINTGRKMSAQTRENIARSRRGQKLSADTREKISKSGLGRKHTQASIEKMRIAQSGRIVSDIARKKLSDSMKGNTPWNKGKSLSDEHKKNLSISHTGITTSRKGRNLSPEHIAALKEAWARRKQRINIQNK